MRTRACEKRVSGKQPLVRKDGNRRGGGVEMFIRSMINYKIGLDLMPDNLETITVETTKPKAKPFHLNRWYRPPDTSVDVFTDYEILMQKMDMKIQRLFVSAISIVTVVTRKK